ncbi:isoprenylcysteine carboxylmethyltransferase family protein [Lentibacter algarum]|uniref:methyltransferase family protein n=1 Tax=Lentibacter algarum TaxID=576131 RepID=UPI001C07DAEF|nr:isoprenylcysteine carboxylmethyltransferase family protein [Lentibacter algarum]MBU2982030.1 isoprenylcysteine carboxylmethyltransferase family protein [Lentibacter algarum]
MKAWLDIPPAWLLLFLGLSWLQATLLPVGPVLLTQPFGFGLIFTGLLAMVAAVWEMRRHKTTVIPRRKPRNIVTGGVFTLSRNPIYLGDALVLAGASLYWGALPSLVLVPVFMWLINWRFIEEEEASLRAAFADEFAAYEKETRRWL